MMQKYAGYLIIFLPLPLLAQQYLCPTTNRFVSSGASLSQVLAACGKPLHQIEHKKKLTYTNSITTWTYQYVQPLTRTVSPVYIQFKNNRVSAIGFPHGKTVARKKMLLCPHGAVIAGSSTQYVLKVCGVAQSKTQQTQSHDKKIIELVYQPRSYMPPKIFVFEDGRLVGLGAR